MKSVYVALCLVALFGAAPILARGQVAPQNDLTSCISEKLRDFDLETLDRSSLLTLVMSINSSDFDIYQHSATLNAQYAEVFSGAAGYSDFTQKRDSYAEAHQSEVREAVNTSHLATKLPSEAFHTIETCMRLKAQQHSTGLRYTVEMQDSNNATLNLQWVAPVGASPTLKLVDSWIQNGYVPNAQDGKLFSQSIKLQNGVTLPIQLVRKQAGQTIKLGVITENHLWDQVAFVEVPQEKPAPLPPGTLLKQTRQPIAAQTCRTNGNNDAIWCTWLDVLWIPQQVGDEIDASATLAGVQLAVDTCPDPHRRGNVKIACGTQQAEAGMLGHNDITNWQQDYTVATYCKASGTQAMHITVSVNPRGCTQMTLTEGGGNVSLREVTP